MQWYENHQQHSHFNGQNYTILIGKTKKDNFGHEHEHGEHEINKRMENEQSC